MNSQKDIAIGICVYNRQELISKQIEYINYNLRNAKFSYTLIVYDDCSSVPISIKDARFEFILKRGDRNVGLIEARNRIIKIAKPNHKNIIFIDDDIFVFNINNAIEKSISWLDSGYSCVTIPYSNLPIEYRGGLSWFKYIYDFNKNKDDVVFFNGGSSVFCMKTFEIYGDLEGRYLMYLEEEDLAIRIYSGGGKIKCAVNESFVSIHDQPPGKKSHDRSVLLLSNRFIFHKKFIKSKIVILIMNFLYCILYFFKSKNPQVVFESISRFNNLKNEFSYQGVSDLIFFKFMIKRYLNA